MHIPSEPELKIHSLCFTFTLLSVTLVWKYINPFGIADYINCYHVSVEDPGFYFKTLQLNYFNFFIFQLNKWYVLLLNTVQQSTSNTTSRRKPGGNWRKWQIFWKTRFWSPPTLEGPTGFPIWRGPSPLYCTTSMQPTCTSKTQWKPGPAVKQCRGEPGVFCRWWAASGPWCLSTWSWTSLIASVLWEKTSYCCNYEDG